MDDKTQRQFRSADDVDTTFAEAVVHVGAGSPSSRWSGHKVLGFRLRPFSFWHAANLDFIESPFAGHRAPLDFAALYVAARTCRLRYPATFRGRKFERLIELFKAHRYRYVRRVRSTDFQHPNSLTDSKADPASENLRKSAKSVDKLSFPFLQELNKFSAYLRDYISRPEYIASQDSTPVKSPWYLYEVCLLKRHNPEFTWAQCWDTPVGWAAWHNAGMLEASGNRIDILTPELRASIKHAEELMATVAAGVPPARDK